MLNVAIVGGGLAGALAARVLRERHRVTVYERAGSAAEVGAAINIGPNGVKILETLGFDRHKVGSLPVKGFRMWTKEGEMIKEQSCDFQKDYGADWLFNHRADLREEFIRLATEDSKELGVNGSPATIRYGARVVRADVHEGILKLENGETIHADLVVAADGIKSAIRPLVVGDAAYSTAKPSGFSAFRFTIPRTVFEQSQYPVPTSLENSHGMAMIDMIFAQDSTHRSVVIYPCRNFQLLNFVCIAPDSSLQTAATESWSVSGSKDELLDIFRDFPTWALEYISLAEDIKLWQLRDQDPLPSYILGRTVLIGDAAHPMTPHQGQGGTQAVEDAEGFRLFNVDGVSRANVPSILKDYDSVRRPRASQIQIITKEVSSSKDAKSVRRYERFNWTYPGIFEEARRVKAGEDIVPVDIKDL